MELWAIIPELVVAGLVLLLLPLGSLVPRRHKPWITWIAILGLIAASWFSLRMLSWQLRSVFEGTYAVDPFAIYFKVFACAVSGLVLLSTESYFRGRPFESVVPVMVLLVCLSIMGLGASQNLALIALFIQLVTVSSYILVGLAREPEVVTEAALKLFLFSAAAGATMLFGMSLIFGLTGTLQLPEIGPQLKNGNAIAILAALGLILAGYGYKITMVPFHFWAPDTYQGAPTPIAALLSVGPKAGALAVLLRTLIVAFPANTACWEQLIAVIAVVTMSVGNLLALRQHSVKRLLAFSSIAQAGYLLVGIAAAAHGRLGASGFLFYLVTYLFMNLGAFLALDGIERKLGTDNLDAFSGVGYCAPVAGAVLTISLLALAGFPPFGGFVGKAILLGAALDAGWLGVAIIMAVNFAVSLYFYLRVIERLYLRSGPSERLASEPILFRCALIVLAVGSTITGVFPSVWAAAATNSTRICCGLLPYIQK